MKKNVLYIGKLLLVVCFLTYTGLFASVPVYAQTCIGVQTRTTTCVDPSGNQVAEAFCTTNGLPKPTTWQDCDYHCPMPPTSSSGCDIGGGGDGGGDAVGCGGSSSSGGANDDNGDGKTDSHG